MKILDKMNVMVLSLIFRGYGAQVHRLDKKGDPNQI